MGIPGSGVAILEISVSLVSHMMKNSYIEFLKLENMGTTFGIVKLY